MWMAKNTPDTLPKTEISPENRPSKMDSVFRGYVSFRVVKCQMLKKTLDRTADPRASGVPNESFQKISSKVVECSSKKMLVPLKTLACHVHHQYKLLPDHSTDFFGGNFTILFLGVVSSTWLQRWTKNRSSFVQVSTVDLLHFLIAGKPRNPSQGSWPMGWGASNLRAKWDGDPHKSWWSLGILDLDLVMVF